MRLATQVQVLGKASRGTWAAALSEGNGLMMMIFEHSQYTFTPNPAVKLRSK
jgi:hypothetical protein